jgi:hypothetical protein
MIKGLRRDPDVGVLLPQTGAGTPRVLRRQRSAA